MAKERKDKRGAPPGHHGNPPHVRNEKAAEQVEIMAGFAMPFWQIAIAVDALFDDQGYSQDTIERHYRPELDRGLVKSKALLMQGAYDLALGRNVPDGVSPDKVYDIRAKKIAWLLSAVHGVAPVTRQWHSGPNEGPINYAELTDEEIDEEIAKRLNADDGG